MHISRVDLNLFVVLDAIHAEGSLTAAARKLSLTQPAVSHALGRLRAMFDDPLFERRGQGMAPTPLARTLIPQVREALAGFERTLHESTRFDAATSARRFTLGVRDALESTLLPPLLGRVSRESRAVQIAAVRFERRGLESELLAGTLDAAIDIFFPVSSAIRHAPMMSEPMIVLARKGHPALARGLDMATYLGLEHVQVSSRRQGASLEDLALQQHGHVRRVRLRCQDYTAACRVVSRTDLISTLPQRYAHIANEAFGNQMLPLPFEMRSLELYLYWHAGSENDAGSRWLRERVLEAMRDTG
jgi:DNA-binding transcriptional LysR family regulator